ncbi:MAG: glycosyltransferase family 2 protein, partial [Planctomycetota bacterium]
MSDPSPPSSTELSGSSASSSSTSESSGIAPRDLSPTPSSTDPGDRPRVAIGVPIYENAQYLREALDDLVGQTYRNFRAVLVDDGTTDGSAAIIDAVVAADDRFTVVRHPKNTGLIHAWRVAAEGALALQPDYFAWMGDHDRVDPNWLEALVNALDHDSEAVLAYAKTIKIDDQGSRCGASKELYDSTSRTVTERIEDAALGRVPAGDVVYGLFRADALRACGVFRPECFPDRLLVSEVSIYGTTKLVSTAARFRRVFGSENLPMTQLLERQLATLFHDGNRPDGSPVVSFLTALLRAAEESTEPEVIRLRRRHHAWCFLIRHRHKFRKLSRQELDEPLRADLEPYRELVSIDTSQSVAVYKSADQMQADHLRLVTTKQKLDRLRRKYRWALALAFVGPILHSAARVVKRFIRPKRFDGPIQPNRVLHVVPKSILRSDAFHGSTKDIRNRTEYFEARSIRYDEFFVSRDDEAASREIAAADFTQYGCVIVDLPGSLPRTLGEIRRRAPQARVMFRSHNAEFFHRLDWVKAAEDPAAKREYRKRALKNLIKDAWCMLESDRVIAISDWDTKRYWRWLGRPSRVVCVPYFFPASYVDSAKADGPIEKEDLCICIGSSSPGPLTFDQIRGFADVVGKAGDRVDGWRFQVTGGTGTI